MNLYTEIYKAINEGVIKSLKIDDDNNDINYTRQKINNNFNLVNKYFNDFFNNPTKETYTELLNYAYKTQFLYKADTIQQLNEIYNKIKSIKGLNDKNLKLTWIDTSNVFLFITDTEEYPLHLYDKKMNTNFIKIISPELNNDIILHKNLFIDTTHGYWWCIDEYKEDWMQCKSKYKFSKYKGYEQTQEIQKILKHYDNEDLKFNIFQYIKNLSTNPSYSTYIPSIEELEFVYKYQNLINYMLQQISDRQQTVIGKVLYGKRGNRFCFQERPNLLSIKNDARIWSSSQTPETYDEISFYILSYQSTWEKYGKTEYSPIRGRTKIYNLNNVFPFFKKI